MISPELLEEVFVAYAGENFRYPPDPFDQSYEGLMFKESYDIIREDFIYSKLLTNYLRYWFTIRALIPDGSDYYNDGTY